MQKIWLAPLALGALGLAACAVESTDSSDAERHALGKADAIGSCADGDPDSCGGKSDGNCWCDDLCESFGDCCDDKGQVCDGEAGCCDPDDVPLCIEGSTCCEDGTWGCNNGAGQPTCDPGVVCGGDNCCDPDNVPPCIEGATCCTDGTWGCNNGAGQPTCDEGTVCEDEGCLANSQCSETEFCAFEPGTCGEGGAGECSFKPEACILLFDPVCGCDGVTYGNACTAASNGISVQFEGECPDEGDPNSCEGNCGSQAPGGCWCDELCEGFGDCCDDKAAQCDAPTCSDQGDSCANGESCCTGLQCCAGVPVPPGQEFCGQVCPISDKNKKEHFAKVDTADVLRKVSAMEITTWNYKFQDDAVRHLGPMAQDFKAAFALGSTDKSIFTVDADGVALASIQALSVENKALKAQLKALEARLGKLERK